MYLKPTRRTVLQSLAGAVANAIAPRLRAEANRPLQPLYDPLRPSFHYLPAKPG